MCVCVCLSPNFIVMGFNNIPNEREEEVCFNKLDNEYGARKNTHSFCLNGQKMIVITCVSGRNDFQELVKVCFTYIIIFILLSEN